MRDELESTRRNELHQNTATETYTFRNRADEAALPMRRWQFASPGNHLGGAGLLGAALAHYARRRMDSHIERFDRYGLTGWTFASLVLAFWMIPAALDAALGNAVVNCAKYASLIAAGFALSSAMRRSPVVLEAFFIGNFVWMSATVGLVYQSAETQLCLNYVADSQERAGRGLVFTAITVLISWIALRLRYNDQAVIASK